MGRHEAIFLEEPPAPDFEKMLTGAVSVADYLMPQDMEYPRSAGRCATWKDS